MKHTNVYIVDDSLTIRAMMQSLIEQDDTFEVCGLAADAEQALDDISSMQPEIILLDLALPSVDGLAFLDRVQELIHDPWAAMKVIVVSSSAKHDAPICDDAFQRGAAACFDKARVCAQSEDFMSLLREVSQGTVYRAHHLSEAVTLPSWLATDDDNADHDDEPLEGTFEIVDKGGDQPDAMTFI
jgi:chemotaxis response regulator CheB